jgi:hypothetical protein
MRICWSFCPVFFFCSQYLEIWRAEVFGVIYTLYTGGSGFDSRPRHRVPWFEFFLKLRYITNFLQTNIRCNILITSRLSASISFALHHSSVLWASQSNPQTSETSFLLLQDVEQVIGLPGGKCSLFLNLLLPWQHDFNL